MSYRFIPPEGRDSQTLHQVLARRAASRGEAPWIVGEERSWTYRDIDSMSDCVANGFAALGIAGGDTVLVMLPDCVEFIVTWCGLAKLEAVQVPVNTHLRGNVLTHVIEDSRARTMMVHAQFLDRIADVALGRVESLVVLGEMPDDWPDALVHLERSPFGALFEAPDTPLNDGPAATDLAAVLYTSGTTGPSKGVMITHIQAYEYARSVVELLELVPDDVYYAPLPLFHIAGQWGGGVRGLSGRCASGAPAPVQRRRLLARRAPPRRHRNLSARGDGELPLPAARDRRRCRQLAPRMAYFMVPRYVEVVGALPKTQTGKIRKYALRERGITPGTWDREAAGIRPRR